ncbi:hypothetical protein MNBD_GAMMA09-3486 [hydrothermal vent metagenome]|uniref:Porin domain-containing protein n=1 Tax=hydrothermal vent metagenome TaxID=652676 RepID=A0A3B0XDB2_9ZZZZ
MKQVRLKRIFVIAGALLVMPVCVAQAAIDLDPAARVKLFGDFRLRGEYDDRTKQDGTQQSRNRLRYRVRLGIAYQVNERWSAKARMATNISSINSPHVTFGDDPDVGFDQAYLAYQFKKITASAGKLPLNYWNSSEMVWDKDFNPDALSYVQQFNHIQLNAAHIILQDNSWNGTDDKIEMLQAVYAKGDVLGALGYFNVNDGSAAKNIFTLSAQYKPPGWRGVLEVSSSDAKQESLACALQLRKKLGEMGFRVYYFYVGAQSIPGDGRYGQDDFPDQNGAGLSNFKGVRLQYDQKLDKNANLDVRLYSMRAIDDSFSAQAGSGSPFFSDKERLRLQMNLNLKF